MSGLIAADTHVDEADATWEYMGLDDQRFKPVTEIRPNTTSQSGHAELRDWATEGIRTRRVVRNDAKSGTRVEARELLDVEVRLRHVVELLPSKQVVAGSNPVSRSRWSSA